MIDLMCEFVLRTTLQHLSSWLCDYIDQQNRMGGLKWRTGDKTEVGTVTCFADVERPSTTWLIVQSIGVKSTETVQYELQDRKFSVALSVTEIAPDRIRVRAIRVRDGVALFYEALLSELAAVFEEARAPIQAFLDDRSFDVQEHDPVSSTSANDRHKASVAGRLYEPTLERLYRLLLERERAATKGSVSTGYNAACGLVRIDPKTAQKHMPMLRDKWDEPSVSTAAMVCDWEMLARQHNLGDAIDGIKRLVKLEK